MKSKISDYRGADTTQGEMGIREMAQTNLRLGAESE
jgi:hypothetical protein